MSQGARVESIEELKFFRAVLCKFAETSSVALGDAESELHRTLGWLEREQSTYWAGQLRTRSEDLNRAKDALRQKKLYKSPTGARQSTVEEEKAVAKATRRIEEAQQKILAVRKWAQRLQKEILIYKGQVQRFGTLIESDIPVAISKLDKMVIALESYASLTPAAREQSVSQMMAAAGLMREDDASMARAVDDKAAAEQPTENWPALRSQTPSAGARAAAETAPLPEQPWASGAVNADDLKRLVEVLPNRSAPAPRSWLIIGAPAWNENRIYLERLPASAIDDSGWFIGPTQPVEGAEMPLHRVDIERLLALRPDLRDILSLPTGVLVVIESAGLCAVLDPQNANLWAAAPNKDPKDAPK